jgi:ABC-type Fe3+/spermidine/putrescine transport system ATPase subunit
MSLRFEDFRFNVPGRGEAVASGVVGTAERVVIRGPSGCGKTTLLRAVAGLVHASGKLFLGDREISALPPQDRRAGLVFQGGALFPHLSVRENVAFGLRHAARSRDWSDALLRSKVDEGLARVGLEGFGDREPGALSGGERQRVALLRGLIWEPEMALLDEPLSAVDAERRSELQSWIKGRLEERPVPVIIVTHDSEEARVLGTRVVEWNSGQLSF